jgi:hypothetical protein
MWKNRIVFWWYDVKYQFLMLFKKLKKNTAKEGSS